MQITEKKEVTRTTVEKVIIGRKCDVCKRDINKVADARGWRKYNYFLIHTWHNDWGNDSVDSNEYYDACCSECVIKFASKYLHDAQDVGENTMAMEVTHVMRLEDGSSDGW